MKSFFSFLMLLTACYCQAATYTSTSATNTDWATATNWSPNGIPAMTDIVIINSNITYTGTLNMGSAMDLTINAGKTLTVTAGMSQVVNVKSTLTNNGTLAITGDLTLYQGMGGNNSIFTNAGTLTVTGGNFSNTQSTTFTNTGIFTLTNGNFTLNQQALFTNGNGGVIDVNNTGYGGKSVNFTNLDFSVNVTLSAGSTFNIIKSSVTMTGNNTFTINGELNVSDGNVSETMPIILGANGIFSTLDTDASGDGVVTFNNGGQTITNNGKMFIESISTSGGSITITDNNIMFIRNIASGSFDDGGNNLNVSATGVLYYCGDPLRLDAVPTRPVLGTVTAGGKLYYTKEVGSYQTTSPNHATEVDFTVANADQIDMSTIGYPTCSSAYSSKLSTVLPIELTNFDMYSNNENTHIIWETASETNNNLFELYYSTDGINFMLLSTLDGCGTCSYTSFYEFEDIKRNGIVYYKLRQIDFDGKFADSKIISQQNKTDEFILYPNPAKSSNLRLQFLNNSVPNVYIKCVSITGELIFDTIHSTNEDFLIGNEYVLQNGIYYFEIYYGLQKYVRKVIITN